jgi:IrrE N-terminal-like domain
MSRRYSTEDLKEIALRLRRKINQEDTLRLNMRAVLDELARASSKFKWEPIPDAEVGDGEGLYDPNDKGLRIPNRILAALDNGSRRASFTVAHEISHWLLDHKGPRYRRAERKAYELERPDIRRDEREADQLAAFILAPDHLAEHCRSVHELREKFGLSHRAAQIRWKELEADRRRKSGEKPELPSAVVAYLRERKQKGDKVTSLDEPSSCPEPRTRPEPMLPTARRVAQEWRGEPELCIRCGHLTAFRLGLQLCCDACGHREPL